MPKKKTNKKSGLDALRVDVTTLKAIAIKDELNKLFYNKPNYSAELEMLKYQYDKEEEMGEERIGLHASSITTATKSFCYRQHIIAILYMEHVKKGRKIPKAFIEEFKRRDSKNRGNFINLQRIFEEGKSIGTKWQRLFIRGNLGVKEDMDVSRWVDEYDLSYTPDAIINLFGEKYVVEIKSSNRNQYENMKEHKSGRKQLKLYMHLEGINRGFVLVDNKDTSDFTVFPVIGLKDSDDELLSSISLLEEVQRQKLIAIKKKKLPPCTCKKCMI